MRQPMATWWLLFMHWIPCALIFAFDSAGRSIPARIAMIAMTTSSSISVKPDFELRNDTFIGTNNFGLPRLFGAATRLTQIIARGQFGRTRTPPGASYQYNSWW